MPKSWLQQGQQWRIVAELEHLIETAPARAAELRAAASTNRTRAAETQPLLGRPFEHADKLAAALARQKEIDAAMRAEADAATNSQGTPGPTVAAAATAVAG
jgi:hypothetical protein